MNTEILAETGEAVAAKLKTAAEIMANWHPSSPEQKQRIGEAVGEAEDEQAAMNIVCVVWLDALLMMNALARENKQLRPSMEPPKLASACVDIAGRVSAGAVSEEWEKILNENYESVFRLAKDTLPVSAMPEKDLSAVFVLLLSAAEQIEAAGLQKTANVCGEIFARVMRTEQRKNTAAFYTRPHIAEFLAAMVMPARECLPADWTEWRIADFACGTGSLLLAAYRRLAGFADAENINPEAFHRQMAEHGICGYDISAVAVHLSAAAIIGMRPAVSYENMNIGMLRFGRHRGSVYAGSLELFAENEEQKLFNLNLETAKGRNEDGTDRLSAPDGFFSAVIMNPPYSRTRIGQSVADLSGVSDSERGEIQKRISQIRQNTDGNGKAGLASDFTALASKKLADGGRLGFVLPLTMASAGSWSAIREHLAEHFRDIVLVFFTADTKQPDSSLSDDTSIGEVILAARKTSAGREGLLYVCVDEMFQSADAGSETAKAISETERRIADTGETEGHIRLGEHRIGEWRHVRQPGPVWGSAGAKNLLGTASAAETLASGGPIGTSQVSWDVVPLREIFDIGSTHHKIGHMANVPVKGGGERLGDPVGAFKWHEILEARHHEENDLALWHAKADRCEHITADPTHYGTEHDSEAAKTIREEKTDMFLQRYMSWASHKTLAARTRTGTLGGVSWAGLRHPSDAVKFAFTIWANSIFGFVSYWYQSQRQHQGRSLMQMADIARFRVPDFGSAAMLDRAEEIWRHADEEQLFTSPLKKACLCPTDPHRQTLNRLAASILAIPDSEQIRAIENLQSRWAEEPSVSG